MSVSTQEVVKVGLVSRTEEERERKESADAEGEEMPPYLPLFLESRGLCNCCCGTVDAILTEMCLESHLE